MSNNKWYIATLAFVASSMVSFAQSVEIGYVKEYNGADSKTPLSGVELNILGASSTVSGQNGEYELRFSVMRPGDAIQYNEIYKSGYVLFNVESLKTWRISNNRTPFVIVMCNERKFRELKAKYYNLFDKSYKREYEQAVLQMKREALEKNESEKSLKEKLAKLEEDYREKLNNINTYVETFARIDRSEMSDLEAEALSLVDEGKIEEGIEKYEQLEISKKANEQIARLNAGQALVKAGQTVIESSHSDLLVLAEKLKTQIGLYEMGGSQYDHQRLESIFRLVDIYRSLKESFGDVYNNELGKWMVARDKYDLKNLMEAAELPSYDGMLSLGIAYETLSYATDSLYDKAIDCYHRAIELYPADSLANGNVSLAEGILRIKPSFSVKMDGTDIFFRISNETENAVILCPRSVVADQFMAIEDLIIPDFVPYQGRSYKVIGIDSNTFSRCFVKSVSIPSSIRYLGDMSFYSSGVSQCVFQDFNLEHIPDIHVFPKSTVFRFPKSAYRNENCYQWMTNIHNAYEEDEIRNYPAAFISITEYLSESSLSDHSWERANYYFQLARLFSDAELPVYDYDKALNYGRLLVDHIGRLQGEDDYYLAAYLLMIQLYARSAANNPQQALAFAQKAMDLQSLSKGEVLYQIGNAFFSALDYAHAVQYYRASIENGYTSAYNELAYMYANGRGVEKDLRKAHDLIDRAIASAPEEPNYYDSKGEFFLFGQDTLQARYYLNLAEEAYRKAGDDNALEKYHDVSTLFKELGEKHEETSPESWREEWLQKALPIICAVSRMEFRRLAEIKCNYYIEYEELLSIGIIAAQVLCKNKTPEQVADYSAIYIAAALRWAIENEIKFRQGFLSYFLSSLQENDFRDMEQAGKEGIDLKQFTVKTSIFQTGLDIAKECANSDITSVFDNSDVLERIVLFSDKTNEYIDNLPDPIDQKLIRDLLDGFCKRKGEDNVSLAALAPKYDMPWMDVYRKVKVFIDDLDDTLRSIEL